MTKDALAGYDEFAVAGRILGKEEFLTFARPIYEKLSACMDMQLPQELKDILSYKKRMYEEIAEAKGIAAVELRVKNKDYDPNAKCFCPLCLAEYATEMDVCVSCEVRTRGVEQSKIRSC